MSHVISVFLTLSDLTKTYIVRLAVISVIVFSYYQQRMFQTVPDCLYAMGQVTSLHIFLTDQYNEITCSAK